MIIFPDVEPNFTPNAGELSAASKMLHVNNTLFFTGISDSVEFLTPFLATHNVTAGDLIQLAAAVGITLCPGAPKLQFLAGRPNATAPAPDGSSTRPFLHSKSGTLTSYQGLIPEPQQDLTTI